MGPEERKRQRDRAARPDDHGGLPREAHFSARVRTSRIRECCCHDERQGLGGHLKPHHGHTESSRLLGGTHESSRDIAATLLPSPDGLAHGLRSSVGARGRIRVPRAPFTRQSRALVARPRADCAGRDVLSYAERGHRHAAYLLSPARRALPAECSPLSAASRSHRQPCTALRPRETDKAAVGWHLCRLSIPAHARAIPVHGVIPSRLRTLRQAITVVRAPDSALL